MPKKRKLYSKRAHQAGDGAQCGSMRCEKCGNAIDGENDDWLEAKRDTPDGYDWGYVTFHRNCSPEHGHMWRKIEFSQQKAQQSIDHAVGVLKQLKEKDQCAYYSALEELGERFESY